MKYAVKVPFNTGDKDDDMLFVTEGDPKFHFRIKLFNTIQEAQQQAKLWSDQAVVVALDDNHETHI
jgi:hypothetical protein